ncbi:MAG: hypothetical protein ACMG6S_32300 [Byssovorax sp.]
MMRNEVIELVALGPMPDEDGEEEAISAWENGLKMIQRPLTHDEAAALAKCFPPDLGYGMGWSLLHLVESAPDWSSIAHTINTEEWRNRALKRIANAQE